jgi:ankyrin repeat protein
MKHLLLTTIAAVVLVGCGNPEADRALLKAAGEGNTEAVKQHLAAGADVNAKDLWMHYTALHFAASAGRKEVAELLIDNGADVNAKTKIGITPLATAGQRGKTETADLLRKHGGKYGTILGAAYGGDIEAVKEFLAAGANVNVQDKKEKRTPLDYANKYNHTETADFLRKHGGKTGAELKAEGK